MNLNTYSLERKIDTIDRKLDSQERKIESLERKIGLLLERMDCIKKDTKRMDSHITFVEGVYDSVKSPFHFVMNKISRISIYGTDTEKSIQRIK